MLGQVALVGISDWINAHIGISAEIQLRLFQTAAAILLIWLARLLVLRAVLRDSAERRPGWHYRWRRVTTYVASALSLVAVTVLWARGLGPFATSLGIFSAGLTVALKDPLINIAGWAFVMTRRPFKVGDRVQIGEYKGDVIDIRIFQFTLMEIGNWVDADQTTGRLIHVPNGKVFTEAQANYDQEFPYIWHEIPVLITFESDWRKAKSILEDIADKRAAAVGRAAEHRFRRAARRFLLLDDNLKPVVFTTVRDSGVLLTIRYLCHARERRATEAALWEEILAEFTPQSGVELAYPTQRFYRLNERPNAEPNGAGNLEQRP